MPKETPVVVGKEPIEIIGQQRAVRTGRGEPRVVEMSIVDTVVPVQHYYNSGCETAFGGLITQTAFTRFAIRHNLTVPPNEVIPQRIDNDVDFAGNPGTDAPLWYHGPDPVPDNSTYSGFNQVLFRSTVAYGNVLLNTCEPYADEQYSYFTVGFPISVWPMACRAYINGGIAFEVPEYWGDILTATAQPLWGSGTTFSVNQHLAFPALDFSNYAGLVTTTVTACSLSGDSAGEVQIGPPAISNRMVRVSFIGTGSNDWEDKPVLVNVFTAPRNGSKVKVRVINKVWENVSAPRTYVFPSADAKIAG